MSWLLAGILPAGGVGGAILAGLSYIGSIIVRGLQFIYTYLLKFLQWSIRNPEAGVTLGALLWLLAT